MTLARTHGHEHARVAPLAVGAVLVAATLVRYGLGKEGVVWSICQMLLVAVAWIDLRRRVIPDALLIVAAGVAIALRASFAPTGFTEGVVAGLITLLAFLLFAWLSKSGLGMGDVKLAGLLGLLLGKTVALALLIGSVAGSVVALTLVATGRSNLRGSFAYGPYLALGASLAIVFANPLPLV